MGRAHHATSGYSRPANLQPSKSRNTFDCSTLLLDSCLIWLALKLCSTPIARHCHTQTRPKPLLYCIPKPSAPPRTKIMCLQLRLGTKEFLLHQ